VIRCARASAGEGDAIAPGIDCPRAHALGHTPSALRAWQNGLPAVVILSPSASLRVNSAENPGIRNAVILSASEESPYYAKELPRPFFRQLTDSG